MPTNSEIYEQGVLDAEHDDLNPFYYQHYYFYRRGYDTTRRRLRGGSLGAGAPWIRSALLGLGAVVLLVLAYVGWNWYGASQAAGVETAVSLAPTLAPSVRVVATPTPEPTVTPSATEVPRLAIGGRARIVNVDGASLRARANPGLGGQIQARFPEGSEVTILEGPVEAEALMWWRISGDAGEGWSVERSAEGLVFLEALP